MKTREIIQQSINYIEDNLKTEISAEELANNAGFSLYHFYRIFQNEIGMPVMQYVLRRRLVNAIYEIGIGGKMIDVVLTYGFDTHAGFFKAFRREYDCSPSKYIKGHKPQKPYKINLNQETHIMIAHKKISEMLKCWNMENEKVTDVYVIETGYKNERVFYVGDKYVLRITKNISSLKTHIEITKALDNAGITAATSLLTKDGKEYIQDGELYFSLNKRLEGQQIKSGEMYEGDYKTKARYLGEIIGQLHQVLNKNDHIICNDTNIFDTVKDWAMPESRKLMNLPDNFCNDYLNTFGELCPKLPKQIIHRDPNPGNIIMSNGKLSGFIDFDISERNIRLFDPCYAATAILSESFGSNDSEKLAKWLDIYKNIIYGYDSVAKLSDDEKKALPYVILSIQMIFVAYLKDFDELTEMLEANKNMSLLLIENREKLTIK